MGINIADIIIAILLILALLYGWRKGTVNVLAQAGSLILAYQAARACSAKIAAYLVNVLPPFNGTAAAGADEGSRQALALLSLFLDTSTVANRLLEALLYIAIFIFVRWLVRKAARMLTGVFGRGLLGKLNKAIGAFAALVLMIALIVITVNIILPACVKMGFGHSWLMFFRRSALLMPILNGLSLLA